MKKFFKTMLIIVVVIVALMILLALLNKDDEREPYDPTESFADFAWPESDLVNRIPKPEAIYGKIHYERADSFSADIGNTTREQFDAYLAACQDAGFIEDYSRSDTSYYAYDAEGYYIHITYDDEYSIMDISTRNPKEEEETTTTTAPAGGLDKDFKAAMDAYEKFINEYVDIVKKYTANPTDMSLLEDYTDYLNRYAEVCNTFAEWEDEDLSTEELAYYVDVQARVAKKLLEVAG